MSKVKVEAAKIEAAKAEVGKVELVKSGDPENNENILWLLFSDGSMTPLLRNGGTEYVSASEHPRAPVVNVSEKGLEVGEGDKKRKPDMSEIYNKVAATGTPEEFKALGLTHW